MQIDILLAFCSLAIFVQPALADGWRRVMPLIPINGPSWFIPSNKNPNMIAEVIEPPSVTDIKPGTQVPVPVTTQLPVGPSGTQSLASSVPPKPADAVQPTVAPLQTAVPPIGFPAPGWMTVQPTVAPSAEQVTLQPTVIAAAPVATTASLALPSIVLSTLPPVSELTNQTATAVALGQTENSMVNLSIPSIESTPAPLTTETMVVINVTGPAAVELTTVPAIIPISSPIQPTLGLFPVQTAIAASVGVVANETTLAVTATANETTSIAISAAVTAQPAVILSQAPLDGPTAAFLIDTAGTNKPVEPVGTPVDLFIPTIGPNEGNDVILLNLFENVTTTGTNTNETMLAATGQTAPVVIEATQLPLIDTFPIQSSANTIEPAGTPIDLFIPTIGPNEGNDLIMHVNVTAPATNDTTVASIIQPTPAVTVAVTVQPVPSQQPLNGTTISFQIDTAGTIQTVESFGQPIDLLIPTIEPFDVNITVSTTPETGTTGPGLQVVAVPVTQGPTETMTNITLQSVAINVPTVGQTPLFPVTQGIINAGLTASTQGVPVNSLANVPWSNVTVLSVEPPPTVAVVQETTPLQGNIQTTVGTIVQPVLTTGAIPIQTQLPFILKKSDGSAPNRPGFTNVPTSGKPSPCAVNKDCFNLREPNEWCPMPNLSTFM